MDDRCEQGRLEKAREYEERFSANLDVLERPLFHLPAHIGWMNDPNGFSFYNGRWHLFYQYYPYEPKWGPMHWGHAVSDDLLRWEHLPCAMAPDMPYDNGGGCFSGSAIELEDGRHMLMYTGVSDTGRNPDGTLLSRQVQCVAFGDGVDYVKYENNPVIAEELLPEGLTIEHFRDPKIWREADGSFACVVGARDADEYGHILKYASDDGINWRFVCDFAHNDGSLGTMWECPDTFELDGKQVLLVSPQDMLAEGDEFSAGNSTLALIGHTDETGTFVEETHQATEYGIDFYATQTALAPDGRRIMVAWMQNWDSVSMAANLPWFGQVTVPRELSVRNGRLIQWPIRELESLRGERVAYERMRISGERSFKDVSGRMIDLTVTVRPAQGVEEYREFAIWFARNDRFHSSIRFSPAEQLIKINRKHSGLRRDVVHHRKCKIEDYDGELKLRIILDRFSAEVFVGEGEHALSMVIPTELSADGITFFADGEAIADIEKYDLTTTGTPARN